MFARVEMHYGRDPAAFLEDDVLAHNLRLAFMVTLAEEPEEEDLVDKAKRGGARIREQMRG